MAEMEQKKFDNKYYQDYYKKNAEHKKEQRRENYKKQKRLAELEVEKKQRELENSLYNAESIKVLMSLKQYTEFSKEKRKLWADFVWTFNDLKETGFYDITQIQKLELLAVNLIQDYRATAKAKSRKLERNWNSLTNEEQRQLIRSWGREKVRKEKALADKLEEFVKQGESYEKEIEIDKFHQERGKIKCECWKCQQEKEIKGELKAEQRAKEPKEKVECGECKKMVSVSSWNEEAGACKKCVKRLNG